MSESLPDSFLGRSASARHELDDFEAADWPDDAGKIPSVPCTPGPKGTPQRPLGSYAEARGEAILRFEREYVLALLQSTGGNVSEAARVAKMDRVYLHRLMRRHRTTRTSVTYGFSDLPPEASAWLVSPSASPRG